MDKQKYYNTTDIFNTPAEITSECADISFLNLGTSTVLINNTIELTFGVGVSFTANWGEMDMTRYMVRFRGAGVNNLLVIRKYYIDRSKSNLND